MSEQTTEIEIDEEGMLEPEEYGVVFEYEVFKMYVVSNKKNKPVSRNGYYQLGGIIVLSKQKHSDTNDRAKVLYCDIYVEFV